ncbi:hypothetical protein EJ06DRAFT_120923 [Trichodelitschia bisporula]|uniref:Uncharacterized protein n=1 Tax=Trichodelitschia bisporula TaxID=703511 RepID=A0A6G1HPY4_9PEZI|nr:hypothetical protein EJ06DRAFT_120923 [Trichodelitschia bisporula]
MNIFHPHSSTLFSPLLLLRRPDPILGDMRITASQASAFFLWLSALCLSPPQFPLSPTPSTPRLASLYSTTCHSHTAIAHGPLYRPRSLSHARHTLPHPQTSPNSKTRRRNAALTHLSGTAKSRRGRPLRFAPFTTKRLLYIYWAPTTPARLCGAMPITL